jgi:alpha-methylacyl-CoA racemase
MTEAPTHPQSRARESFLEVDGLVQPSPAPRYSITALEKPRRFVPLAVDAAREHP